jgi:glycerol-3-phosphate acyltransferase PlsY
VSVAALAWALAGFASGALMFSLWIGRLALRKDIRGYGDGNPGATNVLRAGGKAWGGLALLLDVLKGAIPVWLAQTLGGVSGAGLVLVALAPVLGHAFSPLVGWRGGKAVAVTFGIWTGLTIWEAPSFLGILLGVWFAFVSVSGWAMMLAMGSLLVYYLLTRPDPVLLAVWAGNAAILAYKHRADLAQFPAPRGWLAARLGWRS